MGMSGMTVTYGGVVMRYSKGLTSRRCLLIFGLVLVVAGVAGFFVPSQPGGLFTMGVGQSIAFLVIGLSSLYVGEVWNSEYKRIFIGVVGVFFLAVAIAGFVSTLFVDHSLGIDLWVFSVEHPWENTAHLILGVIFGGTALYPRRFRDYSFGTNVSD
jgi:MFS family permease